MHRNIPSKTTSPLTNQRIFHHYLVVFYYIIAYTHAAWMAESLKSKCSNLSELYIWERFQIWVDLIIWAFATKLFQPIRHRLYWAITSISINRTCRCNLKTLIANKYEYQTKHHYNTISMGNNIKCIKYMHHEITCINSRFIFFQWNLILRKL